MVVDENGQGYVDVNNAADIIDADEEVSITLSLYGSTAAYNASGLVLFVYVREIK